MGSGTSKYANCQLTSYLANPLVVFGPEHVHYGTEPIQYEIGNFIRTRTGQVIYDIDRHINGTDWYIAISDVSGHATCTLKVQMGGLFSETFPVFHGTGETKERAMKVTGSKGTNKYKMEIKLASGDVLVAKVEAFASTGGVVHVFSGHPKDGGFLIAQSSLGASMKTTIAPGVDVPAVAMICVLAHEIIAAARRMNARSTRVVRVRH
ncbi:hypothetical protein BCR44DRAFT_90736 [Catenaria anguillulae PL171]|uniref:Tubby C-terminal-like domain-containing protein n=1 Tax=Catenaria anguillulae PL171 TaxID=765915 RepID=A0A1Y2HSK3_9FUNG|nr:hypothetical protein BCR44DRAFT_90736 [Catenaria anguillulae PL171]